MTGYIPQERFEASASMGLCSLTVALLLLVVHPYQALGSSASSQLSPFLQSVSSKAEAAAAFADTHAAFHTKRADGASGIKALYSEWKAHFKPSYIIESEDDYRFEVFSSKLKKVMAINQNDSISHWAGLNQFSAMTWEEFKSAMLKSSLPQRCMVGLAETSTQSQANTSSKEAVKAPATVDWRLTGQVSPVRDQGEVCGSCWAHASTSCLESAALIQLGKAYKDYKLKLSVQQLVDCTHPDLNEDYYSDGCNGGRVYEPYVHAALYGLVPDQYYPYSGRDGICKSEKIAGIPAAAKLTLSNIGSYPEYSGAGGFEIVLPSFSEAALKQAVAVKPFTFGFCVTEEFDSYWGGDFEGKDCSADAIDLNHAMTAVGYTPTAWIVKNSYGTAWGDKGFVYIKMTGDGEGVCGMYQCASVPAPIKTFPDLTLLPNPSLIAVAGKRTLQSSTLFSGYKATDGDLSSFSSTLPSRKPWWAIKIGMGSLVTSVSITLRSDAAYQLESMHDIDVWIGWTRPTRTEKPHQYLSLCVSQTGTLGSAPGEVVMLTCNPSGLTGRYLAIQIREGYSQVLSMAEVKVYGYV